MRNRIVKFSIFVLLSLLLAAIAAYIWSSISVSIDQDSADPSVSYLNSGSDGNPYKSNFHQFKGHTLHYVEAGEGETILFLHGFPSYWFSFHKQMERFRSDYRVIAIDGLGAGRSDAPKSVEAYKLQNMSEHVMGLMDDLGVDSFHLVGHDWGSAFAFSIAQRHPKRVKSVTGIAAPPLNVLLKNLEESSSVQERFSYMEQFKTVNPLVILTIGGHKRVWTGTFEPLVLAGFLTKTEGLIFKDATDNPKRINALINWYRANIPVPSEIDQADYWPAKDARITVPALVVWGNIDPVFVPAFIDQTKDISEDLQILVLENVAHRPHIERANQVSNAIQKMVELKELQP